MAILRSGSPHQADDIYQQVGPLFDQIEGSGVARHPGNEIRVLPIINIYETDTQVILEIEIDGIALSDLDIKASEEAIFIKGKRRFEVGGKPGQMICSDNHHCQFQQIIPLPVLVQNAEIYTDCKDQILYLTMPKDADAGHRIINVSIPKANNIETASASGSSRN